VSERNECGFANDRECNNTAVIIGSNIKTVRMIESALGEEEAAKRRLSIIGNFFTENIFARDEKSRSVT